MKKNKKKRCHPKRTDLPFDPDSVSQMKKFFANHEDYTPLEISLRYKIPTSTLRYWRRKCGLKSETVRSASLIAKQRAPKPKPYRVVPCDEDWDNAEWFREHYVNQELGVDTIARMLRKSKKTIYYRLIRYKIPIRTHAEATVSKNPCFSKEWIYDRYMRRKWTIRECANEAGVSDYTIYNWLVNFGIRPRNSDDVVVYNVSRKNGARI